jgi:hypothetical protein
MPVPAEVAGVVQAQPQPAKWRGGTLPNANTTQSNSPPSNITAISGIPVAQLPVWRTGGRVPGMNTGVPGTPVSFASGNPDVATVPSVPPPKAPYGVPRPLGVGQETSWRGGVNFANDKMITSDRHLITKTGTELSGRRSGLTDPPMDGPSRPSYYAINRTINYQQGTDNDANQDDLTRPYTRNAQGMYVGEQGTGWTPISGGVPGLWQPYGSYAGYTNGPVQGIQSPVAQGAPGDGKQTVWSGPPHGLHSPTMPDYASTLGYYMAVPQMRLPRIDRPANSPQAGQSYSQTIVPQGQKGTIAQRSSGQSTISRSGAVNWQNTRSSGWRGQSGAGNAS